MPFACRRFPLLFHVCNSSNHATRNPSWPPPLRCLGGSASFESRGGGVRYPQHCLQRLLLCCLQSNFSRLSYFHPSVMLRLQAVMTSGSGIAIPSSLVGISTCPISYLLHFHHDGDCGPKSLDSRLPFPTLASPRILADMHTSSICVFVPLRWLFLSAAHLRVSRFSCPARTAHDHRRQTVVLVIL